MHIIIISLHECSRSEHILKINTHIKEGNMASISEDPIFPLQTQCPKRDHFLTLPITFVHFVILSKWKTQDACTWFCVWFLLSAFYTIHKWSDSSLSFCVASFVPWIFTEQLLCAKCRASHWGHNAPPGTHTKGGDLLSGNSWGCESHCFPGVQLCTKTWAKVNFSLTSLLCWETRACRRTISVTTTFQHSPATE